MQCLSTILLPPTAIKSKSMRWRSTLCGTLLPPGEVTVEASLASLPFGEVSLSISDLLSSHLSAGVLSILFFSSIYFLMSERTFLSLIGS